METSYSCTCCSKMVFHLVLILKALKHQNKANSKQRKLEGGLYPEGSLKLDVFFCFTARYAHSRGGLYISRGGGTYKGAINQKFLFRVDSGFYKRAPGSFLFSRVNPSGLPSTKLTLIAGREVNAIYCHSRYGGASFGSDDVLLVASLSNSYNCFASLDNSYQCPTDQNANTFLTGNQNFKITEMKVFVFEK